MQSLQGWEEPAEEKPPGWASGPDSVPSRISCALQASLPTPLVSDISSSEWTTPAPPASRCQGLPWAASAPSPIRWDDHLTPQVRFLLPERHSHHTGLKSALLVYRLCFSWTLGSCANALPSSMHTFLICYVWKIHSLYRTLPKTSRMC